MSPLGVVMTLGGVGSQVEAMTKSLEANVLLDAPAIEPCPTDSTDPTFWIIANGVVACDVALQLCSVIVLLHCTCLWHKLTSVVIPPLFQLGIGDGENCSYWWTCALRNCPLFNEFGLDGCEFNSSDLSNTYSLDHYIYTREIFIYNVTQLYVNMLCYITLQDHDIG